MAKSGIDINADLGEGAGNDARIMPLISSCNIAAGGHFGDAETIRGAVVLAQKYGVKVGAHPSFPDKENFGRTMPAISKAELEDSLCVQLDTFRKICTHEGVKIHHIKPHGALYNQGANDPECVEAMCKAFDSLSEKPIIYLQHNSLLHEKLKGDFPVWNEAFIDRVYASENALLSRKVEGSLISSPEKAWKQLFGIFDRQEANDIKGRIFKLVAKTYCIHGDQPNAVAILEYIHEWLSEKGIELV